jgi:hypothetical protein
MCSLKAASGSKLERRSSAVGARSWLRKNAPLLSVLLVLAVFLTLQLSFGRFTRNDEILMKAPGREWAATGFWRNPEGAGHRHLTPPVEEVWMAHVPFHPFVYGLWIKAVGVGFRRNILFDALIHCALVLLSFSLARLRGRELSPWFATGGALLTTVVYNPGRPEEILCCFGLLAYLLLRNATLTPKRLILSGLSLGLCAATHPAGTLLYAGLCSIALLNAPSPLTIRLRRVVAIAVLSSLVMVASVTPILILHPTAWHQFFVHVGQQMHPSYHEDLRIAWRDGRSYLFLIFGCAVASVFDLARTQVRFLDWFERYGFALTFTLLLAVRLPRHPYYFWYVPPVLVPAATATLAAIWARGARFQAYALGLTLAAFGALGALDYFKELVLMAALPPEQRAQPNADTIRRLVPPGSRIAAGELWGELGNEYHFRTPNHDPLPLEQIDYVLLFPNGQRNLGEASKIPGNKSYFTRNFRLIYDNLPRTRTKVFGLPAANGFWGFGPRIYVNTSRAHLVPTANVKPTE